MAQVMLPAALTRVALAGARYGPSIMKAMKTVAPYAAGAYGMARGTKRRGDELVVYANNKRAKTGQVTKSRTQTSANKRAANSGAVVPYVAPRGGRRAMYEGSGGYAGAFSRRRSKRKIGGKKVSLSKIKQRGIYQTTEIIGQVNDPDAVYIGYSAYSSPQILDNIATALISLLFQKAGQRITNVNDTIPAISGTAGDIVVQLVGDANVSVASQAFSSGVSGYSLIIAWLKAELQEVAIEETTTNAINILNIKKLLLFMPVIAGTQTPQSKVHLDDVTVHVAAWNELKLQNRSASYEGSSSTDVVNSNPLIGKIYDFERQPVTSIDHMKPLQVFDYENGVLLKRAAEFTSAAEMKEPPSGRIFNNTKKTDKVVLQPGQIRKSTLYYTHSEKLIKFIKKLALRKAAADAVYLTGQVTFLPCPSQIVALEDVINYNATNKITVAYELNRQQGVMLTLKNPRVTQQTYATATITNTT